MGSNAFIEVSNSLESILALIQWLVGGAGLAVVLAIIGVSFLGTDRMAQSARDKLPRVVFGAALVFLATTLGRMIAGWFGV